MRNIFGNVWTLLSIAAYGGSLAVLWPNKSFGHEDAIVELILSRLVFPLVAWITTLRARPLTLTVYRSAAEMSLLVVCLVGVTLYLIWGPRFRRRLFPPAAWLQNERSSSWCLLGS